MATKFLDSTGAVYLIGKVKDLLSKKVDVVSGKGLSTNDYTTAEKTKLSGIAEGANKYVLPTAGSTLGGVKTTSTVTTVTDMTPCPIVDGVPYYKDTNTQVTVDDTLSNTSTNPVQNKVLYSNLAGKAPLASPTFTGAPKAPTAAAGTNTTQIATTEFVTSAVAAAVGSITGISFSVVTTLPSTGAAGVIYLVSNGGSNKNAYDEYIYVNNTFEKIGTTAVDLSGYLKSTDVTSISTSEIDVAFE